MSNVVGSPTEDDQQKAIRILEGAENAAITTEDVTALGSPPAWQLIMQMATSWVVQKDSEPYRRQIAAACIAAALLASNEFDIAGLAKLMEIVQSLSISQSEAEAVRAEMVSAEKANKLIDIAEKLNGTTKRRRTTPQSSRDTPMTGAISSTPPENANFADIYKWLKAHYDVVRGRYKMAVSQPAMDEMNGYMTSAVAKNPNAIPAAVVKRFLEAASIDAKIAVMSSPPDPAAQQAPTPPQPPEPAAPQTQPQLEPSAPPQPVMGSVVNTHTYAAESGRLPVAALRKEVRVGNRTLTVAYRERPADQLVTAMLGTACTGDRRAPGCYHIPGRTNVPCATAAQAVTGMCNFKTIAVPHENPVGNSEVFKVYRGLDVGAQIKLQMQRALIRYGYAAAILPVYSERVLDRHFAVTPGPAAVGGVNLISGGNPIDVARRQQGSNAAASYGVMEAITRHTPEYAVSPHYTRVLSGGDQVPPSIYASLRNTLPPEARSSMYDSAPNQFQVTDDRMSYGAFPIYIEVPGTRKWYSNPAYVSDKYKETGVGDGLASFNKRRMIMLKRGAGMLLRAMQHLRNAMVLYLETAGVPMKTRLDSPQAGQLQGLSQYLVIDGTNVPRGAFAFLSQEDLDAIRALATYLRQMFGDGFIAHPDEALSALLYNGFVGASSYKVPVQGEPEATTMMRRKLSAYMEVLWSYWHDNNVIGKLRCRMNFKTKLAMVGDTVKQSDRVLESAKTFITADILRPYGWSDASLYGLVVAHLTAVNTQQQ